MLLIMLTDADHPDDNQRATERATFEKWRLQIQGCLSQVSVHYILEMCMVYMLLRNTDKNLLMCISVDAMDTLDDSLLSLEKLDRTSPELWPEQSIVCDK
jgi:hypothetical protein